ncbi:MAG: glycosyltransferase [Alphaproteobacteria bacterium]
MKKVIHLITGLNTGGAEKTLFNFASNSDNKELTHIVISMMDKGVFGSKLEDLGVKVYTLNMKKKSLSLKPVLNLISILKKEKPDILQTWLYHADFLGLIVGKLCGIKHILWNIRCSNMDMSKYSLISKIILKALVFLSHYPEAIIFNSYSGKAFHQKIGYKNSNWIYFPNGFDMAKYQTREKAQAKLKTDLKLADDAFIIGHIARFDPMKDHFSFVKACEIVSQQLPNAVFVLIGKGVDNDNLDLKNEIENSKLSNKTFLLGECLDLSLIYGAFDVLCLSSIFGEGFPNVLGEAMACGVPCVTTDVGDAKEIVKDTGITVPIKDPVKMAEAIMQLSDKALNADFGSKAVLRIKNEYSLVKCIDNYNKYYQSI